MAQAVASAAAVTPTKLFTYSCATAEAVGVEVGLRSQILHPDRDEMLFNPPPSKNCPVNLRPRRPLPLNSVNVRSGHRGNAG